MSIEAMKLALEALETLEEHLPFDWAFDELQSLAGRDEYREDLAKARSVIPVLYQAIEQAQKQEPVAWRVRWPKMGGGYAWVMNDAPLMQEHGFVNEPLYTSPPQQKQEPVGETYLCDACFTPFNLEYECPKCGHGSSTQHPVYTSPPQRQPLTDKGLVRAAQSCLSPHQYDRFEALLENDPDAHNRLAQAIENERGK